MAAKRVFKYKRSNASAFFHFLGCQNTFVLIEQLYQVHAFAQIGDVILIAFDIFKFFDAATDDAEDNDLANGVVVILNGNKIGGGIRINGEIGPRIALGLHR